MHSLWQSVSAYVIVTIFFYHFAGLKIHSADFVIVSNSYFGLDNFNLQIIIPDNSMLFNVSDMTSFGLILAQL